MHRPPAWIFLPDLENATMCPGSRVFTLPVLLAAAVVCRAAPNPGKLEFNRDIRPILSDNCFACHGPDPGQRKAGLRLDTEATAFADRGGYTVLVKSKPDESELIRRIEAVGKKSQMPPPKSTKKLTA